ncbi:MAG: hypothetical protein COB53_02615 [Elusimicrobia bacterium]|nr:MAG: hypothetical protein COB53_02615 [Elusimicrobiota bacterium]
MNLHFLKQHLNLWWLRPESALWDASASQVVSAIALKSPSLDLGCGNGLWSFVTAGGSFSAGYDWFLHADSRGFSKNKDIYDVPLSMRPDRHILRRPRRGFDWAFDHKANLLSQAASLGFYENVKQGDGNRRLPFEDEAFQAVFSNILYWLRDPSSALSEINRILALGGRTLLCIPDPRYKIFCESYQWKPQRSRLLKILNRGRSECHDWTATFPEIKSLAKRKGFVIDHHETYLSPKLLRFWDVGLRLLSPPLLDMVGRLTAKDRLQVKKKWIQAVLPAMTEMLHEEGRSRVPGGFHFVVLRKKKSLSRHSKTHR